MKKLRLNLSQKDKEKIESAQLWILCGYPYAGKSYIAEQLCARYDVTYVSIDDIFYQHGYDWTRQTLPAPEAWQRIFTESYDATKQALLAGQRVLYDSTNQTKASRDTVRAITDTCGAVEVVVYVKTPVEQVWQRYEKNLVQPTRSVVPRDLVHMTISMFEEPMIEENHVVIKN